MSTLRIFDTATRSQRDFEPIRPGHASIYLCGATPQAQPHIGHLRSGVAFDILRRWLLAQGYDVALVRNVTDIDDKILTKAAENNRPWWEWVSTYEREFTKAYNLLGVLPPSVEPRATGFVTQMVEYMQRLIDAGFAYPVPAPAHDAEATRTFDALRAAVSAARSLKNELGLAPQERLSVAVEGDLKDVVFQNARVVGQIARVDLAEALEGRTLSLVEQGVTVRVPLEGTVDVDEWLGKQRKRLAEFEKQIKQAQGKLNNEGFVARAPAEVVEEERRRVADFSAQKERLESVLAQFQ